MPGESLVHDFRVSTQNNLAGLFYSNITIYWTPDFRGENCAEKNIWRETGECNY